MREELRILCVLAVFRGAALRLAPEGGVRRILQVLVTALLLSELLGGLHALPGELSLNTARLQEREQSLLSASEEARKRMNRLVIEEELRTYIQNKAAAAGLELSGIELSLRWETEGLWLPDAAVLTGRGEQGEISRFLGELCAELGIERGKLEWREDDGR